MKSSEVFGKRFDLPVKIKRTERVDVARSPGSQDDHVTWDLAHAVLGYPLPEIPTFAKSTLPLRDYQEIGADFLAARSYAILSDPPRAGKTITALAAAKKIETNKTLILCPANAKIVWAHEIKKWLDVDAIILFGRRGDDFRIWSGKKFEKVDLEQALNSKFIIANFEILQGQTKRNEAGEKHNDITLPGWAEWLTLRNFDVAIIDEIHNLRGFQTGSQKTQINTTRERTRLAVSKIPIVWGLTGTPVCGRIRDLWGPLDVISGYLWSGGRGTPFQFDVRYCSGRQGQWGWTADGESNIDELIKRLDCLLLRRNRDQILPDMPPKIRRVINVEHKGKFSFDGKLPKAELATELMSATIKDKIEPLCENLLEEILNGEKSIVLVHRKANAEFVYQEVVTFFEKEMKQYKKLNKPEIALMIGGEDRTELEAKRANFVETKNPAIIIATIDLLGKGAISLRGASSEHWLEYHFTPAIMLQAEDRPYELGLRGLSILYYVCENSIDEAIQAVLLPKIELLANTMQNQDSKEILKTLTTEEQTSTLEDVLNFMMGE